MNTKRKGDISELAVITQLAKRGYNVLIPFGDSSRYDVVIERDGSFERVQVKTGTLKNGAVCFRTCSSAARGGEKHKPYVGDVDFFGVYCPQTDKCYLVPISDVGTSGTHLRVGEPGNAQRKGVRWARAYEI
jgi:hypothetical protein